jgi:hypothetical protein
MELGSHYRYIPRSNEMHTIIFVYEISKREFTNGEGLQACAIGVNIQDSSDIRKIPHFYWQHWTKVE